jgi:hypothetical protein
MKGITGVKSAGAVAYDLCPNQQCPNCFGQALAPQDRAACSGQRCHMCGAPRYYRVNAVIDANKR